MSNSSNSPKVVLEGNKIDLSLANLKAIPVKAIQALPKGTELDLSCNQISSIGNEIGSLVQLVKLDLSKNCIKELPDSFGNLIRLQHLDLSENQITELPLSFSQLTNLRFLDLKGNPLSDKLRPAAGFCLDVNECYSCARKVVAHYKNIKAAQDKIRMKEEQKRIEELRKQRAEELRAEEALKRNKKLEKEKRRLEHEQQRLQENLQKYGGAHDDGQDPLLTNLLDKKAQSVGSHSKPFKFSPKTLLLLIFAGLFIAVMFYFLAIVGVGPTSFMKSDL